jgi:putative ABC transport system ATP-binding protein
VQALRSISLVVDHGDFIGIMGPSGSGKSTLLNILGLLDSPTQGSYLLGGTDVARLDDRDRSHVRGTRLGFVFQSYHLLPHLTSMENVQLGLLYGSAVPRRERAGLARDALRDVGLEHRIHSLCATLSGGEQQRVAIARAIVGRPDLLLCDEPTGNLDSTTSEEVLDSLSKLHTQGLVIVLVTHDSAIVQRTTRVIRVRDGIIVEPDPATEGA